MLSRCLADAAKVASRSVSIGFRFNPILFASKDFATKSNGDKHLTIDRPGRKEEIPRLKQGNTRLKTREIAQETARLKEETARLKEEIALLKGSPGKFSSCPRLRGRLRVILPSLLRVSLALPL